MKVLMAGLGSVGQRHLLNLRTILGDRVEIIAYRATHHRQAIVDCRANDVRSLEAHYGIRSFVDLDAALAERPDAAFIANPTALHVETAIAAARAGCHLYIEKPLSHTRAGIDALRTIADERGLCVMVGYQTRFHPCIATVRKILGGGDYGGVASARFEWGTWLPEHHPYEDYRAGYAANTELGGGVVLSLSHEIDLIHHLIGEPTDVHAVGGAISDLNINADDTAAAVLSFASHRHTRLASLYLSFAQRCETRAFCLQLDGGRVDCDLIANTVRLEAANGDIALDERHGDLGRNELFLASMREFLAAMSEQRSPIVGLDDGDAAVETSLRIKAAMEATSDAAVPA